MVRTKWRRGVWVFMYFDLLQRGRSQSVTVSDDSVISTSASVNGTQTGMYNVATLWAHSYLFWLEK